MVAHVVLFSPRPELSEDARQSLADAFEAALREIPSIRRAHVGRRIVHGRPYEGLMTVDYQYAAILEFEPPGRLPQAVAAGATFWFMRKRFLGS